MITPPYMPTLPQLSHLQFRMLTTLVGHRFSVKTMRDELRKRGIVRCKASIHEVAKRLEHRGLVRGEVVEKHTCNRIVKERRYRITPAGTRAIEMSRVFHSTRTLELMS